MEHRPRAKNALIGAHAIVNWLDVIFVTTRTVRVGSYLIWFIRSPLALQQLLHFFALPLRYTRALQASRECFVGPCTTPLISQSFSLCVCVCCRSDREEVVFRVVLDNSSFAEQPRCVFESNFCILVVSVFRKHIPKRL